jgi:hypothetical protein
MDAKIAALKEYATNRYNKAGWDYFTECYTNIDWARLVDDCKTLAACKKEMRALAAGVSDRAETCDFEY